MKITYVMFGTKLTGGVRVIFEIANRLVERKHDVTIVSLGKESDHIWFPLRAKIKYVHAPSIFHFVNVCMKRIPSLYFDLSIYEKLKVLCEAITDCEINVATFCLTSFPVFESGKGKLFFHMQHLETLFYEDPFMKKLAEETYYLPLNKFANSSWLQKQVKETFDLDVPVIPPAIDHSVFYPHSGSFSQKLRVLCFAKQNRWKGFPEALAAMSIVLSKRSDVEFVAYGQERPTYFTSVPYVFVKNPSDVELASLYSSADVVICPSWYESFPLYPLEAMACGAPVITTPLGTEDYAFHEKNCLVVQPRDPKKLADAILLLLSDFSLREQFSKSGIETSKQFTWDKTTDKVEKLFRREL